VIAAGRSLVVSVVLAAFVLVSLGAAVAADWTKRLEALDPVRPSDYFELGEEVADAATTDEERELARTLYGLAGTLAPQEYGRSAALAQAALAGDERRRRTLVALAALLDAGDGATLLDGPLGGGQASPKAVVAVSEAFSHLRRGQGQRALASIKPADVAILFEAYAAIFQGGADRFREDARTYRGGTRPSPTTQQFILWLRIEEAVLSSLDPASERGWSSVLVETAGRPLLEVDTSALHEAFGIAPDRTVWRNGAWSRP
jgi:hypothetical protein